MGNKNNKNKDLEFKPRDNFVIQNIKDNIRQGWDAIKVNDFVNQIIPLESLSEGNSLEAMPYLIGMGPLARTTKIIANGEKGLKSIGSLEGRIKQLIANNKDIVDKYNLNKNFNVGTYPSELLIKMRDILKQSGVKNITDDELNILLNIRQQQLANQMPTRYIMKDANKSNRLNLFAPGEADNIGRLDYDFVTNDLIKEHPEVKEIIDNNSGVFPVMIKKLNDAHKGVSEDLYNFAIYLAKEKGLPGLISGIDLLSPDKTLKVISKYNNKTLLSNKGIHYRIDDNIPGSKKVEFKDGPVYLLTEPTREPYPVKDILFDPSIIDENGNMVIDPSRPMFKNGGKTSIKNNSKLMSLSKYKSPLQRGAVIPQFNIPSTGKQEQLKCGGRRKFFLGGNTNVNTGAWNLGISAINNFLQGIGSTITGAMIANMYKNLKRKSTYVPETRYHLNTKVNVDPELGAISQAEYDLNRATDVNTASSQAAINRRRLGQQTAFDQRAKVYATQRNEETALRNQEAQMQQGINARESASRSADINAQNEFEAQKQIGLSNARNSIVQGWFGSLSRLGGDMMNYINSRDIQASQMMATDNPNVVKAGIRMKFGYMYDNNGNLKSRYANSGMPNTLEELLNG